MRTRIILINALVVSLLAIVAAATVLALVQPVAAEQTHPKAVAGLWTLWPDARSDGDKVRFYFFHEKGIGLYRYGRIGLNNTNSFDWHVDGDQLVMKFRKTGEEKRTRFEVVDGDAARTLMLFKDPKEPLAGFKSYTFVPPSQLAELVPELVDETDAPKPGPVPGRLWIDQKKFATGGSSFSLYQLKDAAIDGRGVGWHHIGDFDDWSTEALTYRYSPSSCKRDGELELWFTVRGEHAKTTALRGADNGLVLVEDPRNFWHVKSYQDAGPSFGAFVLR